MKRREFIKSGVVLPTAGLGSIQWACLLGLGWYLLDEWLERSAGNRGGGADAGAKIGR